MKRIQEFFEQRAFGVCSRLGEKLGLASSSIRMSFIYASFPNLWLTRVDLSSVGLHYELSQTLETKEKPYLGFLEFVKCAPAFQKVINNHHFLTD